MKKLVLNLIFSLVGGILLAGPLGFEKSEYSARRQKLMDQIENGLAITRNSSGQKPNLDFLYLCGVKRESDRRDIEVVPGYDRIPVKHAA